MTAEPIERPVQAASTASLNPWGVLAIVGGLLAAIGVFVPWITASISLFGVPIASISKNGLGQGATDGYIVLLLSLVVLGLGADLMIRSSNRHSWWGLLTIGVLLVVVGAAELADVTNRLTSIPESAFASASPGPGVFMILAGALAVAVSGIGAKF